jgi:uncharacterized 2Fe-2S/4Fe-4S cluster protein (DUF4445 family)
MGHYQICFEPIGLKIECADGTLVSNAAREVGVHLLSVCGHNGLCGRCRVRIIAGTFSPPTQVERELLGEDEIADGYRLSCQTRIRGEVTVYLPSTSLIEHHKIQLESMAIEVPLDPPCRGMRSFSIPQ